jgi:hypothetical protein
MIELYFRGLIRTVKICDYLKVIKLVQVTSINSEAPAESSPPRTTVPDVLQCFLIFHHERNKYLHKSIVSGDQKERDAPSKAFCISSNVTTSFDCNR